MADVGYFPVGRVQSVAEHSFELDVADDRIVWLGEDALFFVNDSYATLVCNAGGIKRSEV